MGGFWEAFGGLWGSKWSAGVRGPAFAMWYLKKMPPDGTDNPPWGPFGDHLGTTWGPFGDHFGIMLATFWIPTPVLGASTPHYHHPNISSSHRLTISSSHHGIVSSSHHLIISLLHHIISSSLHLIFIIRSSQHLFNISLSRYYVISAPHDLDISTPITQQPTTNNSTSFLRFFVSSTNALLARMRV